MLAPVLLLSITGRFGVELYSVFKFPSVFGINHFLCALFSIDRCMALNIDYQMDNIRGVKIWDLWHLFGIYGIYGIYLGFMEIIRDFLGFIRDVYWIYNGIISVIYPSHLFIDTTSIFIIQI